MLLRESGSKNNLSLNLNVITGRSEGDIGVTHEQELLLVAEAVFQGEQNAMQLMREKVIKNIGEQALVDAIAVAAAFNGITKIANVTGLPLDESTEKSTESMRRETGINDYSEQAKAHAFSEEP